MASLKSEEIHVINIEIPPFRKENYILILGHNIGNA